MISQLLFLLLAALAGSGGAAAQPPAEFIDVYTAKVKPDKRMAFEAAMKKMVAANRKHNGDKWIAFYTVYGGEMGTYYFATSRGDMASIETAMGAFMGALTKEFGAKVEVALSDYSASLASESADLRMRRRDLSLNLPDSPEGMMRLTGESRYMRITTIQLYPGRLPEFVDMWKKMRAAMESGGVKYPFSVSVGATGPAVMVYLATYAKTLGDFDQQNFSLPQAVGEAAYRAYQDQITKMTISGRTEIVRFSGALSNPPDGVAAIAPDFWNPKP
jgi:hypothetical protein